MNKYNVNFDEDDLLLDEEVDERFVGIVQEAVRKVKIDNERQSKLRKAKQSAETEQSKPKDNKRKKNYNKQRDY